MKKIFKPTCFIGEVEEDVRVTEACPPLDGGEQVDNSTARVTQEALVVTKLDGDEHAW